MEHSVVVYGMNKDTGTRYDRIRIAKEYGITMEAYHAGKGIALKHISNLWFIYDKKNKESIDIELFKEELDNLYNTERDKNGLFDSSRE